MSFFKTYKYQIGGVLAVGCMIKLCKVYFGGAICESEARLDGKTVIITGANSGIGKETALDLAKRGARVILACRDMNKAKQAADEIRQKTGNGNVAVESLDLASIDSIKKFANKMNKEEEHVDILINNAGLFCPKRTTADGFDMVFGTNHLGVFILTNLLLDKLKKSVPSRIVNVASRAHEEGKMNWDDLMSDKSYSWATYRQSKLANVLFNRELAKRLQGTGVTTYSLHPGVVNTDIGRHYIDKYGFLAKLLMILLIPFLWLFLKTPEQGAQTTIYCAVDESLKNSSGKYYSDCREKEPKPQGQSDEDSLKLWNISEELTKNFCNEILIV